MTKAEAIKFFEEQAKENQMYLDDWGDAQNEHQASINAEWQKSIDACNLAIEALNKA